MRPGPINEFCDVRQTGWGCIVVSEWMRAVSFALFTSLFTPLLLVPFDLCSHLIRAQLLTRTLNFNRKTGTALITFDASAPLPHFSFV
ncbi:hypothetical protein CEXT_425711 [Caerostris extrusa]|uniref:Uncharacterized protein n=1 Tax=Caerostris extrusa TaxID=172846 RepID=A0AAV4XWH1_CAEEX|nr:hypothetical protein CEXT_425711 [Caerostris extrusa]